MSHAVARESNPYPFHRIAESTGMRIKWTLSYSKFFSPLDDHQPQQVQTTFSRSNMFNKLIALAATALIFPATLTQGAAIQARNAVRLPALLERFQNLTDMHLTVGPVAQRSGLHWSFDWVHHYPYQLR